MVLAATSLTDTVQPLDGRTLVTLLHLRDMGSKLGTGFSIVSEMLDDRNRELAQVPKVDDVIVSDKMISLIAAQISENPDLADVLGDLLDAEGAEIYLRPASDYVQLGAEVIFATIVEAARRRSETAIGYRSAADSGDSARNFGVTVNPAKSRTFTPAERDRVVVLAES